MFQKFASIDKFMYLIGTYRTLLIFEKARINKNEIEDSIRNGQWKKF